MAEVKQYTNEFTQKVAKLLGKQGLDTFLKMRKAINDNADLSALILGTEGQIKVTDNGDDSITLSVTLKSDKGLTYDANGLYVKLKTANGLDVDANGLLVNLKSSYGIDVDSDGLKLKQQAHETDASASHSITDPADAPADADALRDDLEANTIPSIESALDALGAKINAILVKLETAEILATS